MPTGEISTGTISSVRSRPMPAILRSSSTATARPRPNSSVTENSENRIVTQKLWANTSLSSSSAKLSKPANDTMSGR